MAQRTVRIVAAAVVFAVVALVGIFVSGSFSAQPDPSNFFNKVTADAFALVLGVAFVAAVLTYLFLERRQTGRLESISSQFGTRTIVLIPLAIAINIVLGAAVSNALKLPLYLDSVGTILVGILCGPLAGAATGFLANILWSYIIPPPFQYQPAAAFAVVAAAIGLLSGTFGRIGWFRPRPNSSTISLLVGALVAIVVVGAMAAYAFTRFYGSNAISIFNPDNQDTILTILGWLVLALAVIAVIGFLALLFLRRDLTVAFVVVSGVVIGSVAAVISAPIAANVFGGVTGSGVDFLVAAFRQAGADLNQATLQQGLLVDPADKMLSSILVYIVVAGMATRIRSRFPQGDHLVGRTVPAMADIQGEASTPATG